jgi:molybdopterin biosynthesis enzyme MoaB
VSDLANAGRREDLAGSLLATRLEEAGYQVIERRVVPDGIESSAGSTTYARGVPSSAVDEHSKRRLRQRSRSR